MFVHLNKAISIIICMGLFFYPVAAFPMKQKKVEITEKQNTSQPINDELLEPLILQSTGSEAIIEQHESHDIEVLIPLLKGLTELQELNISENQNLFNFKNACFFLGGIVQAYVTSLLFINNANIDGLYHLNSVATGMGLGIPTAVLLSVPMSMKLKEEITELVKLILSKKQFRQKINCIYKVTIAGTAIAIVFGELAESFALFSEIAGGPGEETSDLEKWGVFPLYALGTGLGTLSEKSHKLIKAYYSVNRKEAIIRQKYLKHIINAIRKSMCGLMNMDAKQLEKINKTFIDISGINVLKNKELIILSLLYSAINSNLKLSPITNKLMKTNLRIRKMAYIFGLLSVVPNAFIGYAVSNKILENHDSTIVGTVLYHGIASFLTIVHSAKFAKKLSNAIKFAHNYKTGSILPLTQKLNSLNKNIRMVTVVLSYLVTMFLSQGVGFLAYEQAIEFGFIENEAALFILFIMTSMITGIITGDYLQEGLIKMIEYLKTTDSDSKKSIIMKINNFLYKSIKRIKTLSNYKLKALSNIMELPEDSFIKIIGNLMVPTEKDVNDLVLGALGIFAAKEF